MLAPCAQNDCLAAGEARHRRKVHRAPVGGLDRQLPVRSVVIRLAPVDLRHVGKIQFTAGPVRPHVHLLALATARGVTGGRRKRKGRTGIREKACSINGRRAAGNQANAESHSQSATRRSSKNRRQSSSWRLPPASRQ